MAFHSHLIMFLSRVAVAEDICDQAHGTLHSDPPLNVASSNIHKQSPIKETGSTIEYVAYCNFGHYRLVTEI